MSGESPQINRPLRVGIITDGLKEGVDADGTPRIANGGVGVYIYNLVKHLQQLDGAHELVLMRCGEGQRFLWARFLDRSLAPKERIAALRSYESNSKRLTRNAALRGTLRGLLWNETETRAFREKLAEYVQLRSGSRIDDTLRLAVESVTSDIGK